MANINIGGGGGGPGSDTTAVHVDQANEISGVPVKAAPTAADVIIGEDAANLFAKIQIPLGNLPTVPGDADQLIVVARKASPGTIVNGDVVYIAGFSAGAGAVLVELADASSSATAPAYGIARDTFTEATNGTLNVAGTLSGQNTLGLAVGDSLYLSTTAGALANTRPTGTALVQKVGIVDFVDAVNGVVQVVGAGRVNDLPNIAQDFIWVGDATGVPVQVNRQTALNLKQDLSEKGIANGYASLDGSGKVPVSQLPIDAFEFKGNWDAGTNTPALASGVGTSGDWYRVSVAGATNLDGITDWKVGDAALFGPTTWAKVDNTESVTIVNGQLGAVDTRGSATPATVVPGAAGAAGSAPLVSLEDHEHPAPATWAPSAHASSHASIGSDPLAVVDLTRAKGDYTDAEITLSHVIGTPTVDELDRYKDVTGGVSTTNGGGGITSDGDGTITVAAGQGFVRSVDSDISDLFSFDFAAESGANVALADQTLNFVYVEYNAGAPQTIATTTKRTDTNTNLFLGTVFRDGTFLHITDQQTPSGNIADKLVRRFSDTDGLTWANGAIISETGTRNIAFTAGEFWLGLSEFLFAAFDSSAAGVFFRYYRDGVGGWTQDAGETQINNTQYDDGSGTLATLSVNRYGVHWVYTGVDDDVYVIFGRGNYTLNQAGAANPPGDIPPQLRENHAALAGKIVIQESAAVFESIETAFTIQFTAAGVTDHGDLAGLADDDHTQYGLVDASRSITHTGEVTSTGASSALTIAPNAVTNAKLAQMAAATLKGNNTGGASDPLDLNAAQVTAILDVFTSTLKGLVPVSGGVATEFLSADGTFKVPAGGGGGANIAGFEWEWQSATSSPSGGRFSGNTNTKSLVTTLYLNETGSIPSGALFPSLWLSQLSPGDIITWQLSSSPQTEWLYYKVSGQPTLAFNIWSIPVSLQSSTGGAATFSNGSNYSLTRLPTVAKATNLNNLSGTITAAAYGPIGGSDILFFAPVVGNYLLTMTTDLIHSSAGATTDIEVNLLNAVFAPTPVTNAKITVINDTITERQSLAISAFVSVTAAFPHIRVLARTTSATATLGNVQATIISVG